MNAPALGAVAFAVRDASRPLLVLGPSLGTSADAVWHDVLPLLDDVLDVLGWDLPGHGSSPAVPPGSLDALTVADLAAQVLVLVDRAQAERGDPGAPFWYAGVSVGAAVGQQLLLDAPDRVRGAVLCCTAARFGEPGPWLERGALVAAAGTPTQVTAAAGRWFAPGFLERAPDVGTRLLASLQSADRFGYAAVCGALSRFDVRDRLAEIAAPVVAVAGAEDPATTPGDVAEVADGVRDGRLVVIHGAAHLAPAEWPGRTATLVRELVGRERRGGER
ncbi:alpha/beta fold hydrolase [Isoptericola sp. 4D.3]|uniref:Alpha/beta fold hydrolase n=1 Tax=Isoptericola peretonis TaxID=2918523 RepID=A0ABT0J4T8_9MICO|nr:alpha/beta fold hydrolase [Isoptericola sp. 4D.3]